MTPRWMSYDTVCVTMNAVIASMIVIVISIAVCVVFFGFAAPWQIIVLSLFVSYMLVMILRYWQSGVLENEVCALRHGDCVMSCELDDGVSFNGCILDAITVVLYDNALCLEDANGCLLLDIPYKDSDLSVSVGISGIKLIVRHHGLFDVLYAKSSVYKSRLLYDALVRYGANFNVLF